MASKASTSGTRPGASNPPPPSADIAHAAVASTGAPSQTSVLLVQVEALHEDDAIRAELKKQSFKVKHQALVHLSKEDARHFIYEVCDPNSVLHHQQQQHNHAEPGVAAGVVLDTETSTSSSEVAEPSATASPRDKPTTPRTPIGALYGDKLDGENLEDAVHALTSGPVLMLAVEKPNAVADLLELVGPFNPELWPQAPLHCLRARFGKNREELGVRCSLQEATVALEIEFLLAPSGPNRENLRKQSQLVISKGFQGSGSSKKSADVDLEQLLAFLFPSHLQHPNSAGRLFVFGLYGPLDAKARLRSGEKGLHVVTDLELTTMSRRMEREDILSVYKMCSLSQEEEEQVLAQVDQMMKSFPQYSPRDIKALFHGLRRGAGGHDSTLSFHAMQEVILKERCRRVLCMKEQLHPALAPPIQNKFRLTLKRIVKTRDEVAPATLFLKDSGFTGAENATLVARLLSNHAFEICHLDDGNSPSLTQNVRLLRDQVRSVGESREPWNPNCQQHRK